jgi:hypothetical protein
MRGMWVGAVAVLVLGFGARQASAQEKHKYVSPSQCKPCHADEKKGDQYGHWAKSKHAKAFDSLASDQAKEVGKKQTPPIDDPQKSEKCLKCHLTESGLTPAALADGYEKGKGVGCESCHGPGDDYMDISAMKDKKKAIEAGLVVPDEKVCVKCHNKESPTFKEFDYKAMLPKVAHPNPATKK